MDFNRRNGIKRLVAWGGALGAGSALAQTTAAPRKREDAALKAIIEKLTGAKVEVIGDAPLPGLREAIVGGKVLYIDETGEMVFEGHIIDIANRRSLTAQRQAEYLIATTPTLLLKDLDLGDAITLSVGERRAGRELVAFEDPRCGFCKRMHAMLKDTPTADLTLHIFPVSFLGPESRALNERIWCAPDRAQAWLRAMGEQAVAPAVVRCDLGALERNMALADRFRVQGTPTLFTASGRRLDGVSRMEQIEAVLQAG